MAWPGRPAGTPCIIPTAWPATSWRSISKMTARLQASASSSPSPEQGLPDGMTCDAEGMLWIALWGGFGAGRWNPATGEQIAFVEVPVPNATACCFGGAGLDQLLITTAAKETDLSQYPWQGISLPLSPVYRAFRPERSAYKSIVYPISTTSRYVIAARRRLLFAGAVLFPAIQICPLPPVTTAATFSRSPRLYHVRRPPGNFT